MHTHHNTSSPLPTTTQINPLRLFNLSIAARSDVVYEVATGRVWVTAFITPTQAAAAGGVLKLSVDQNIATDAAGTPNQAAQGVVYLPLHATEGSTWARGVQITVAVLLGLAGVGYLLLPPGAARGPVAGAVVGAGVGLLAFSQLVYFGSRTAPAHLPGSFHAVAQGLDWTALSLRYVWVVWVVGGCMSGVCVAWV